MSMRCSGRGRRKRWSLAADLSVRRTTVERRGGATSDFGRQYRRARCGSQSAHPPRAQRLASSFSDGGCQDWRGTSPHRFLTVSADFDGDGQTDTASLLIREPGVAGGLVVILGKSPGTPLVLDSLDDAGWLDTIGVELAPSGPYLTACGKGYWDCKSDEPKTLKLRRPAIEFFAYESASSIFFFDSTTRQFRRVWISD